MPKSTKATAAEPTTTLPLDAAPTPTTQATPTTAIEPKAEPTAAAPLARVGTIDMQALMASALEKGPEGVAMLERLHALHRDIRADAAREAFFVALSAFQAECPSIVKNRKAELASRGGRGYTYNYADFDQIVSTVRPILDKHGLSFSFDSSVTTDGKSNVTVCRLRHTAGHAEESRFSCPLSNPNPGMSEQQKSGGAYTFGRRYALLGALGIATAEDDVDGDEPAAPEEQQPITEEQTHNLTVRLDSVGADKEKFCFYFGIKSVGQLPAWRYKDALSMVEAKERAAGAR